MRKMLVIIMILLVIFIGMIVYKKNVVASNNEISVGEVAEVEEAISKVYLWKEVTKEALPKFNDINSVEDIWLWEAVKNNIENYELTYDEVQAKAKEIFGEDFHKEFPKEGNSSFLYDETLQKYVATEIETDQQEDDFLLDKIEKIENGFKVEIIEYIADYANENSIIIRSTKDEELGRVSINESEAKIQEVVKNNKERFSKKSITLKNENNCLVIKKVE